jgi:hypothetical protein
VHPFFAQIFAKKALRDAQNSDFWRSHRAPFFAQIFAKKALRSAQNSEKFTSNFRTAYHPVFVNYHIMTTHF